MYQIYEVSVDGGAWRPYTVTGLDDITGISTIKIDEPKIPTSDDSWQVSGVIDYYDIPGNENIDDRTIYEFVSQEIHDIISNRSENEILFPSCTPIQFRRYDCEGIPTNVQQRIEQSDIEDWKLEKYFFGYTRARLQQLPLGVRDSGNVTYSDVITFLPPSGMECPCQNSPSLTNVFVSYD